MYRLAQKKLIDISGIQTPADMVRIGVFDYEPRKQVKEHALDNFISEKIKSNQTQDEKVKRIQNMRKQLDHIDIKINEYKHKLDRIKDKKKTGLDTEKDEKNDNFKRNLTNIEKKLSYYSNNKSKLLVEYNSMIDSKSNKIGNISMLENEILESKKIILTTLSMSGIELLDRMDFTYSHLIIDEACQATEISTLIPFMHRVRKVLLVGDQNQLPATVFSDINNEAKFNRSLFERLLDNGIPRYVLNIQYRMNYRIREFPSEQFYQGLIQDAK